MKSGVIAVLSLIFVIILTLPLKSQVPDEILFGTYVASSPDRSTFHEYWDTNLVKLGFNSIVQTVVHGEIYKQLSNQDSLKWKDNRDSLAGSSFGNIVALNSLWNVSDQSEKQVDWVNILSQGVYNIWEAEGGSGGFYSDIIRMRINRTYTTTESDAGGVYLKTKDISGSPESGMGVEINLVEGPFIYQDRDYKITHLLGSPTGTLINYLAIFS